MGWKSGYELSRKVKNFWKLFKQRPGFYIERIEKAFEDLKDKGDFYYFLTIFVDLGDTVKFHWMRRYIYHVLALKFRGYDVSVKKTSQTITIKLKEKSLKKVSQEAIAEML